MTVETVTSPLVALHEAKTTHTRDGLMSKEVKGREKER